MLERSVEILGVVWWA